MSDDTLKRLDDDISKALNFDPLATAEKLSGQSYKDDKDTSLLGIGLAILHNQRKRELLSSAGDTHYNCMFAEAVAIMEAEGFTQILSLPFTGKDWNGKNDREEQQLVFWKANEGLIVNMDSHCSDRLNTGTVWYCWQPVEPPSRTNPHGWYYSITKSGHWTGGENGEPLVWMGYHDTRDGFRHSLRQLRALGTFLPEWPEGHRQLLWLANYMDWKDRDSDKQALFRERFNLLPADVRAALKGVE